MTKLTESDIEQMAIELLEARGWKYLNGPDIAPDGATPMRASLEEVVLKGKLEAAVRRLNPSLPQAVTDEAVKQVMRIGSTDLLADNEQFHELLTQGVTVSVYEKGEERGKPVRLVDFDDPWNNEFTVVNQFTVIEDGHNLRPDVVLFVNGLPLVVMELKNAADEEATIAKAFDQICTYRCNTSCDNTGCRNACSGNLIYCANNDIKKCNQCYYKHDDPCYGTSKKCSIQSHLCRCCFCGCRYFSACCSCVCVFGNSKRTFYNSTYSLNCIYS